MNNWQARVIFTIYGVMFVDLPFTYLIVGGLVLPPKCTEHVKS